MRALKRFSHQKSNLRIDRNSKKFQEAVQSKNMASSMIRTMILLFSELEIRQKVESKAWRKKWILRMSSRMRKSAAKMKNKLSPMKKPSISLNLLLIRIPILHRIQKEILKVSQLLLKQWENQIHSLSKTICLRIRKFTSYDCLSNLENI